jgi:hypothetical protein
MLWTPDLTADSFCRSLAQERGKAAGRAARSSSSGNQPAKVSARIGRSFVSFFPGSAIQAAGSRE